MRSRVVPKVTNIYYSYHVTNFLAGLVLSQKNLESKYKYFYTSFLYSLSKALVIPGLISAVKFESKSSNKFNLLRKIIHRKKKIIFLKSLELKLVTEDFFDKIYFDFWEANYSDNNETEYDYEYLRHDTDDEIEYDHKYLRNYLVHDSFLNLFRPSIILYLKYHNEKPLIHSVHVYSRPGRRLYITKKKLEKLVNVNQGSTIFLSTSRGVISHFEAIKTGVGGLLLYKVN